MTLRLIADLLANDSRSYSYISLRIDLVQVDSVVSLGGLFELNAGLVAADLGGVGLGRVGGALGSLGEGRDARNGGLFGLALILASALFSPAAESALYCVAMYKEDTSRGGHREVEE